MRILSFDFAPFGSAQRGKRLLEPQGRRQDGELVEPCLEIRSTQLVRILDS